MVSLVENHRSCFVEQIMAKMLGLLKKQGFKRASLAVLKANYAVKIYERVGFQTVDENEQEYIMVCEL